MPPLDCNFLTVGVLLERAVAEVAASVPQPGNDAMSVDESGGSKIDEAESRKKRPRSATASKQHLRFQLTPLIIEWGSQRPRALPSPP